MNKGEIEEHARRIVQDHLDDGIEFCCVYEDDELMDADEDDQRAIHDKAQEILRQLVIPGV